MNARRDRGLQGELRPDRPDRKILVPQELSFTCFHLLEKLEPGPPWVVVLPDPA